MRLEIQDLVSCGEGVSQEAAATQQSRLKEKVAALASNSEFRSRVAKWLATSLLLPAAASAEVDVKDGAFYKTYEDQLGISKASSTVVDQEAGPPSGPPEKGPPGRSVTVRRTYHSRSLHDGWFGFGWCSEWDVSLDLTLDDRIRLNDCRPGSPKIFWPGNLSAELKKKGALFMAESGRSQEQLIKIENNQWIRKSVGATQWQKFDSQGRLIEIQSSRGRTRLEYDSRSRLAAFSSGAVSGRILIHPQTLKIAELKTASGARIQYFYRQNNLAEVRAGEGAPVTFNYDRLHNLTLVTDREGREKISYDLDRDLVRARQSPMGCAEFYRYRQFEGRQEIRYETQAERRCRDGRVERSGFEFYQKRDGQGRRFFDRIKIRKKNTVRWVHLDPLTGEVESDEFEIDKTLN